MTGNRAVRRANRARMVRDEHVATASGVVPADMAAALAHTEAALDKVVAQARERLAAWEPGTVAAWLTAELSALDTPDSVAALAAVAAVRLAVRP